MPNLRAGFTIMDCLPTSPALFTSELLAERVVPVPFDESTMVEGTDCPTTVSSPDDDVCGILAAGLEKAKHKSKLANWQQKVLVRRTTSYLPVASSLRGAGTLHRHRSSTLRMPSLGIGTRSRAEMPITPFPSFLLICTTKTIHKYCLYETSYEHIWTWLTDRKVWKSKRANKCLAVKDYF